MAGKRGNSHFGRRGVHRVGMILLVAVAAALAWAGFTFWWLWRNQERVVFQPPGIVADAPHPARRVEFLAADGHPLYGYVVQPRAGAVPAENETAPEARPRTENQLEARPRTENQLEARPRTENQLEARPRTVVIAFHGNADLAAFLVPWAGELAGRAGVTVFVPEYRGYGGISGQPTYATAASDALGALAYTRATFPGAGIVLFGHSLGSALASDVAAAMAPAVPRALVLQSPFTSAQEMASRMLVPPIPGLWRRISRVHYDTRAVVAKLDAPVWVSHGSRDVVIPARMGRAVFDAARRRGELLIVDGAGHNDVPDVGEERYWGWLTRAVSAGLVELEEESRGRLPGLV